MCAQAADRLAAAGRGQAEVSAWLDELGALLDGHRTPGDAGQIASRAEQLQVRGRERGQRGRGVLTGRDGGGGRVIGRLLRISAECQS